MQRLFLLFLALAASTLCPAAEGPIRVLFLGHDNEHHNSAAYLPILMREFGRDAIYFDYFTKPDCLSKETLGHYDAVGTSPMPPLGLILKPQELEDIQAFLQTLK